MKARITKWKPGQWQVGLFIRTPKGTGIELVAEAATDAQGEAAMKFFEAFGKNDPATEGGG